MNNKRIADGILPNGAGYAALVSAGIGSIVLAILTVVAAHSAAVKKSMIFYNPSGPLSGVTTVAIGIWLAIWLALHSAWRQREVGGWAASLSFGLLVVSFLLLIPPITAWF